MSSAQMNGTPSLETTPGFFKRTRAWLCEKEGLRTKLLCSLAGNAAGLALAVALLLPALRRAFEEATRGGAGFWGLLGLAGYGLAALAAVGILVASTCYTFLVFLQRR